MSFDSAELRGVIGPGVVWIGQCLQDRGSGFVAPNEIMASSVMGRKQKEAKIPILILEQEQSGCMSCMRGAML